MNIADIRDRKVFAGLELVNEVIRPVAATWADGEIRSTDNLQLTIRSIASKKIRSVYAYLTYYDENGKELGYDFDFPKTKIAPGTEAKVSLMLQPPEECSYATLELEAEYDSKVKCMACVFILSVAIATILGLQYFIHA